MPCSSPGISCCFSHPQVREWLKQLLIDNTQPLGVDREELVCACCVIYLSGTFPTVGLLALIFLIRKKCGHSFEWETWCPKKLCLRYKEHFDISTVQWHLLQRANKLSAVLLQVE